MDIRLHLGDDTAVKQSLAVSGDIDLSTGDLVFVHDTDAVAQHIRIRLQFFQGEWFLDETIGIPYYSSILVKNPSTNVVSSLFRRAIQSTPGVQTVENLTLDLNSAERTLAVEFQARVEGTTEPLTFSEELRLL